MKIIEVLYSEFSHIYAENYNIKYLEKCNDQIKVIYTNFNSEPYFLKNKVDMVYMGAMPDDRIEVCINKLKDYKKEIKKLIEEKVIFLITGNALEIFSSYIVSNNKKIKGLNIFDYYIEKDMNKRYNSWFIGSFLDMTIVGHRNQFSKCYNIKNPFIDVIGGYGSDLENKIEGIKYNNFHATYIHGPLLIMNPYFTKYLLKLMDLDDTLIYEKEIKDAYLDRCERLSKEDARFDMSDHG